MSRRRAFTVAAALVVAWPAVGVAQTTDLSLGIEALARRDVAGARASFARAASSPAASMRAAAEQWLGHVSWMIYGDDKSAELHLDRALSAARDSSMVLVERARFEGHRGRYADGVSAAATSMARAPDGERRGMAARALVAVAVDAAFAPSSAAGIDTAL